MSTLRFTRSLSVEPDAETSRITLAALEALVRQARTLGFGDEADVGVFPSGPASQFSITVMER